jgi:hypothetical protein
LNNVKAFGSLKKGTRGNKGRRKKIKRKQKKDSEKKGER